MKKLLFFFIIIVTGSLACKKNNTDNPIPELPRIKTTTNSSGINVTYKQDAQGRVTEVLYANGNKDAIVYTSGMATINSYNATGVLTDQIIYELNSEGLATKEYAAGSPPGRTYEYDANKRYTRYNSTSSNGNLIEYRAYYSTSGLLDSIINKTTSTAGVLINHQKQIFEYTGNINNTVGNYNYGYLFLGKNTVLLPSKRTVMNIVTGSQATTDYAYDYDAQSRVTKETATYPNGSQQSFSYSYY